MYLIVTVGVTPTATCGGCKAVRLNHVYKKTASAKKHGSETPLFGDLRKTRRPTEQTTERPTDRVIERPTFERPTESPTKRTATND